MCVCVWGGGGGGGGRLSKQMIKNFTPANNFLFLCHQGFAGLNVFHKIVILKE